MIELQEPVCQECGGVIAMPERIYDRSNEWCFCGIDEFPVSLPSDDKILKVKEAVKNLVAIVEKL